MIRRGILLRYVSLLRRGVLYDERTPNSIFENSLHDFSFDPKVDNIALRIIACREDLREMAQSNSGFPSWYPLTPRQYEERIAKGMVLFCALAGDTIVHMSWVGLSRIKHNGISVIANNKGEAIIGGTVTEPEWRRRHLLLYVYTRIFQYLRERGYSTCRFEIDESNSAAIVSQQILGSRIVGQVHRLKLFQRFSFYWMSPTRRQDRHGRQGYR